LVVGQGAVEKSRSHVKVPQGQVLDGSNCKERANRLEAQCGRESLLEVHTWDLGVPNRAEPGLVADDLAVLLKFVLEHPGVSNSPATRREWDQPWEAWDAGSSPMDTIHCSESAPEMAWV
jgi:hypothetical protein